MVASEVNGLIGDEVQPALLDLIPQRSLFRNNIVMS